MTEPLYHTDAYLQDFDARVTAVEGSAVALDRTAFYPGGGGQPNDVGTLKAEGQTWPVTKVRKAGPEVWHELDGEAPPVGTQFPPSGQHTSAPLESGAHTPQQQTSPNAQEEPLSRQQIGSVPPSGGWHSMFG